MSLKIIERKIKIYQKNIFFTPIRDKLNYAMILLEGMRLLLLNDFSEQNEGEEIVDNNLSMRLLIGRMSRLFFQSDYKFYSISFPFTVTIGENMNEVSNIGNQLIPEIDFAEIAEAISILNDPNFQNCLSLVDYNLESTMGFKCLAVLEAIFMSEPGYMRYDHDPINVNGKLHPLHHLDLNYSSYSQLKMGLNNQIDMNYFQDLHNLDTNCYYVS